jgi:uncharacterized protein (TIGR03435 family)
MKLTFTALFLFGALASAQVRPEFEVASVKVIPPGDVQLESYMPTLNVGPGGVLHISNRRLDEIIMLAYNIGVRQLSGPRWLTEPTGDPSTVTRFEIAAKVPEGAKKDEIPLMLQKLLEDRFKLQVHRESRQIQVYALTVAKGGAKLQASAPDDKRTPGCSRMIGNSVTADCVNMTLPQFVQQLQTLGPAYFTEGPAVDRTGIEGTYDLHLEWLMQRQLDAGMTGPTLFAAVEKLGLKLEKTRDSAEMLIVDRCEQKPTED